MINVCNFLFRFTLRGSIGIRCVGISSKFNAYTCTHNEYNILAVGAPNNSKGVNLKGFHILPNIDIVYYFSFERIDRNKQHRTAKQTKNNRNTH